MSTFNLNEARGFDANIDAFIDFLALDDAEMSRILRAHFHFLKDANDETQHQVMRDSFHNAVIAELDRLLDEVEESEAD